MLNRRHFCGSQKAIVLKAVISAIPGERKTGKVIRRLRSVHFCLLTSPCIAQTARSYLCTSDSITTFTGFDAKHTLQAFYKIKHAIISNELRSTRIAIASKTLRILQRSASHPTNAPVILRKSKYSALQRRIEMPFENHSAILCCGKCRSRSSYGERAALKASKMIISPLPGIRLDTGRVPRRHFNRH